jgi:imidazole glycerol-phosphate synthase subunit HisF
MLKTRLIPVLLLKNGLLVRAERFEDYQIIGNPIMEVQRYNEWAVDELVYFDITRDGEYDSYRKDSKHGELNNPLSILDAVSETCFMPLTWGGRIRTLEDMRERFARGADKIVINIAAITQPEIVLDAALRFGSQAIVICIDIRRQGLPRPEVFIRCGQEPTGIDPIEFAVRVEDAGAGELLLQNIDYDGMGQGYDLDLIKSVAEQVSIPIIANSGAGNYDHYIDAVRVGASAVAAANLFHFREMSDLRGKKALSRASIDVR